MPKDPYRLSDDEMNAVWHRIERDVIWTLRWRKARRYAWVFTVTFFVMLVLGVIGTEISR